MKSLVDQYNAASVEINQRVTEALLHAPPVRILRQIPASVADVVAKISV